SLWLLLHRKAKGRHPTRAEGLAKRRKSSGSEREENRGQLLCWLSSSPGRVLHAPVAYCGLRLHALLIAHEATEQGRTAACFPRFKTPTFVLAQTFLGIRRRDHCCERNRYCEGQLQILHGAFLGLCFHITSNGRESHLTNGFLPVPSWKPNSL